MTSLDEDIARVAALRGRRLEDYTSERRRSIDTHRLGIMVRFPTWMVRRHRFAPIVWSRPEPLETTRP